MCMISFAMTLLVAFLKMDKLHFKITIIIIIFSRPLGLVAGFNACLDRIDNILY